MNTVIVTSRHAVNDVSNALAKEQKTHVIISINEPEDNKKVLLSLNIFRRSVLYQFFSDTNYKIYHPACKLFTPKEAQEIIDFVREHKDKVEVLVVHCYAGISRSSAVAAAVDKIFNIDGTVDYFNSQIFHPNRFVYNTILYNFYGIHQDQELVLKLI